MYFIKIILIIVIITNLQDILRMIIQHLQDEGYMGAVMTLQDEANVRLTEQLTKINHMKKMKKSILGNY